MTEDKSEQKIVALIGTGPISMLKALLLSKDEKLQIVLIDEQDRLGGAWYSDASSKGHEIECGCHIWSYSPVAYKYIENELGVKLDFMKPSPVFVSSKSKIPYSTKNFIDSYKFISKSFVMLKWKRILDIKNNPKYSFKIFGKRNKYPLNGSPELITSLVNKINKKENIKIITKTEVNSVEISDRVMLNTNQDSIFCDQLYLTSVSSIQSISKQNQKINIDPTQVDYIHFLIKMDQAFLKDISYWRIMDDKVIHRITDISYQTNNEENLFLVGIKGDAFHSSNEDDLFNHVINETKKYGLANDSFNFELVKTHLFPTYYIKPVVRTDINNLDEKIQILHSTDLTHGIHYLVNKN